MDQGLKVVILCSNEELGKEAYKSISSMPTDNYVAYFAVDNQHVYKIKSIEKHFEEMNIKLRDLMSERKEDDYYFYIADLVVEILGKCYLITAACNAFKGQKPGFGTSGFFALNELDHKALNSGKPRPISGFDLDTEERAREAANNARAALN